MKHKDYKTLPEKLREQTPISYMLTLRDRHHLAELLKTAADEIEELELEIRRLKGY